ncbi:hypothetical protein M5K25_003150 [Dendrobium thyrsiflorum]|uniref:Uncharacterized protein n=1 Tax=Dendrobium thyrsiflorum TaxID=117978 RepID=A0ABD0VPA5_DENTH
MFPKIQILGWPVESQHDRTCHVCDFVRFGCDRINNGIHSRRLRCREQIRKRKNQGREQQMLLVSYTTMNICSSRNMLSSKMNTEKEVNAEYSIIILEEASTVRDHQTEKYCTADENMELNTFVTTFCESLSSSAHLLSRAPLDNLMARAPFLDSAKKDFAKGFCCSRVLFLLELERLYQYKSCPAFRLTPIVEAISWHCKGLGDGVETVG